MDAGRSSQRGGREAEAATACSPSTSSAHCPPTHALLTTPTWPCRSSPSFLDPQVLQPIVPSSLFRILTSIIRGANNMVRSPLLGLGRAAL